MDKYIYALVFCCATFFVNFSRGQKSEEASMLDMYSIHIDWLDTHSLLAIKLCPFKKLYLSSTVCMWYACLFMLVYMSNTLPLQLP